MKADIHGKNMIKGSTIVEVLSALVIITVVAGIASAIFLNILGKPGGMNELEARELMQAHLAQQIGSNLSDQEIVTANDFTIKQTISVFDNSSNLRTVQLQVYGPQGKMILERKKIIVLYEN